MQRLGTLIILASLLAACSAQTVEPNVPALLTNPGSETLQEIEQTISTALNGTKVTLAADVLIKNSVLVIERGLQRSIERPPVMGRDLGRPHRFQLVIEGSQCVLVDQQSGQQWSLVNVECVKEL
ncbi:MAG: hypothetical protein ACI9XC_002117 [Gammaproteobacteria bacterium]|jgi:hypothetical protein